jgi:hypothetical protein
VVHLHRDIVETIASGEPSRCSPTYSDAVDPLDGPLSDRQTALWLDRTLAFRERCAREANGALRRPDYCALSPIRSPPCAIYDAAELELTPAVVESLARRRAASPQHARGAHRYTPEQFGLSRGALHERFSRYEARFGLSTGRGD